MWDLVSIQIPESCQYNPTNLWYLCCFLVHGVTESSCTFPAPDLESAISSRILVSFNGKSCLKTTTWMTEGSNTVKTVTISRPFSGQRYELTVNQITCFQRKNTYSVDLSHFTLSFSCAENPDSLWYQHNYSLTLPHTIYTAAGNNHNNTTNNNMFIDRSSWVLGEDLDLEVYPSRATKTNYCIF